MSDTMDASRDYYTVLGVDASAETDEIKKAFLQLAKKLHPDRNPGDAAAERRFKDVNEAYRILGDEKRRKRYDQLRSLGLGLDAGGAYDLNDIKDNISRFFSGMFRGGKAPAGGSVKSRKGRSVTYRVAISMEKSLEGGKTTFQVPGLSGGPPRRFTVDLPAGIEDGKRIRLQGQGYPGVGEGAPGDVFLKIQVLDSPDFAVEGDRVVHRRDVDLEVAMLGGEVGFKGPTGATLKVTVPPGTQPGTRLRLPGAGGKGRDLLVEIGVSLPRDLSEDARGKLVEFFRLVRGGR